MNPRFGASPCKLRAQSNFLAKTRPLFILCISFRSVSLYVVNYSAREKKIADYDLLALHLGINCAAIHRVRE